MILSDEDLKFSTIISFPKMSKRCMDLFPVVIVQKGGQSASDNISKVLKTSFHQGFIHIKLKALFLSMGNRKIGEAGTVAIGFSNRGSG